MAGYIRSTLGRVSDRILVKTNYEELDTAGEHECVPELNGEEIKSCDRNNQLEENETFEEQIVMKEKLDGEEEALASDEKEIEVPGYDIAYDHLPTDNEDELDQKEEPLQDPKVFDVLLHPDAGGFGMNLTYSGCQQRLLVSSFRRLHGTDVGPAEASGKIFTNDWLLSVDGEEVKTLEAVYTKLQASGTFVLFRFCRHAPSGPLHSLPSNDYGGKPLSSTSSTNALLSFECFQGKNHQFAALLRELSMKNQLLQDQLNVMKLQLAEKTNQFDDLKAEYSRMKMDSKYIFPTPRRFMRPLYYSSTTSSTTYNSNTLSKYQVEFENVFLTERKRITHQCTQRFEQEKKQLLQTFETNCTQMQQLYKKKQQMMEQGFVHAINYLTAASKKKRLQKQQEEQQSMVENDLEVPIVESSSCSCGTLVHIKNELALHRQEEHGLSENESNQCLVCDLLNEVKQVCRMELVQLETKCLELKRVSTTTSDTKTKTATNIEPQENQHDSHHKMRLDQIAKILKNYFKTKQQNKTMMAHNRVINSTNEFLPLATTAISNHHFATAG
jgi:hypothetical protein